MSHAARLTNRRLPDRTRTARAKLAACTRHLQRRIVGREVPAPEAAPEGEGEAGGPAGGPPPQGAERGAGGIAGRRPDDSRSGQDLWKPLSGHTIGTTPPHRRGETETGRR